MGMFFWMLVIFLASFFALVPLLFFFSSPHSIRLIFFFFPGYMAFQPFFDIHAAFSVRDQTRSLRFQIRFFSRFSVERSSLQDFPAPYFLYRSNEVFLFKITTVQPIIEINGPFPPFSPLLARQQEILFLFSPPRAPDSFPFLAFLPL